VWYLVATGDVSAVGDELAIGVVVVTHSSPRFRFKTMLMVVVNA